MTRSIRSRSFPGSCFKAFNTDALFTKSTCMLGWSVKIPFCLIVSIFVNFRVFLRVCSFSVTVLGEGWSSPSSWCIFCVKIYLSSSFFDSRQNKCKNVLSIVSESFYRFVAKCSLCEHFLFSGGEFVGGWAAGALRSIGSPLAWCPDKLLFPPKHHLLIIFTFHHRWLHFSKLSEIDTWLCVV